MQLRNLFFVLSVLYIAASCAKKDTEKPVITIIEPAENDTFNVGTDSVHVEFNIKDNEALSTYNYLIKDSSGNKFFQGSQFTSEKEARINTYVKNFGGFSGVKPVFLSIKAYDKEYNTTEVIRKFYIQP